MTNCRLVATFFRIEPKCSWATMVGPKIINNSSLQGCKNCIQYMIKKPQFSGEKSQLLVQIMNISKFCFQIKILQLNKLARESTSTSERLSNATTAGNLQNIAAEFASLVDKILEHATLMHFYNAVSLKQ